MQSSLAIKLRTLPKHVGTRVLNAWPHVLERFQIER